MKMETHCHTGGSHCADGDHDLLIKKYLDGGYDGIVITNHISEYNYKNYNFGETHAEKTRCFFSFIDEMRDKLERAKLKCFFGAEICVLPLKDEKYGDEFMVYGITEKMMADNKPFFTLTQKELFEFADKNGLFMYQTHPFRDGIRVGDPKYLHGAEAFNGHYHHNNRNAEAEKFCEENGLIKISGTDYHHDGQPVTAGIETFYDVNSEDQLIECIFKKDFSLVKDQETYEKELFKYKNPQVKL